MVLASNCEKLKLLLWKNWLIEIAHKGRIICYYILPLFFIILLHIMRLAKMPDEKPELIFEPIDISTLNALKDKWNLATMLKFGVYQPITFEILYSPKNNYLDEIMEEVIRLLGLEGFEGFTNGFELEKALMKSNMFAGIEFDERLMFINDYPKKLKYALRFPNELRTSFDAVNLETWHTKSVRPLDLGPRNVADDDGGSPDGYIREGFIALQNAVVMAYLKVAANVTDLPYIQMQRFPHPPYTMDPVGHNTYQVYFFMLFLTFLIPCVKTAAFLTEERENRLKEIMKIMGVQNWIHWMAWFLKSFIVLAAMSSIVVFILKIKLTSKIAVLENSSAIVLYMFFLTYIVAAISFSMLISIRFNRVYTSVITVLILWLLSMFPLIFDYENITLFWKLFHCLSFNAAFYYGNRLVTLFEMDDEGLQWDNLFVPAAIDDELTVGMVMIMLLTAAFLYMLIAMYVEQVAPGEYGIPKVWNFFCQIPSKVSGSFDDDNGLEFIDDVYLGDSSQYNSVQSFHSIRSRERTIFESENKEKPVGVQVLNLCKVYKGKMVVKELTMKMYRDEITVLMGHNGAGKTTVVSMLSGMVAPTLGTAIINGWDIRKNMDEARQSLSICPQYDTLFEDMSVRNHLEFFSRLRGVRGEALKAEVEKYLNVTGLKKKEHNAAKTLSGGMKRNLSVCCALCGNVSVVFFDEPSSGLDTGARRQLWDILQAEKTGRTFLLTTHFMDEAEVLGDRIAIMNDGQLKCYGSSFFLKSKFGTGYHLVCEKAEDCRVETVTTLLRRFIPIISLKTDSNTEMSYTLHDSYSHVFADMFAALEANLEAVKVKGFGITASTLEDVFMTVGADHTRESRISREINQSRLSLDQEQSYIFSIVDGYALYVNHWRAMMTKSMLYTLRRSSIYFLQILLIFIVLISIFINEDAIRPMDKVNSLFINMKQYPSAVTVLEVSPSVEPSSVESMIATEYEEIIDSYGDKYSFKVTGWKNFTTYLLRKGSTVELQNYINKYFMVAATIASKKITCWFNNRAYHTAPLSLNLIHNAIARVYIEGDPEIIVVNAPLPYKTQSVIRLLDDGRTFGNEFANWFSFAMCFVTSYYIIEVIKERQYNFKLLQFIGGLGVYIYWFSRYFWDMFTYLILILITLLLLNFFGMEDFSTFKQYSHYFVILFVFGLSFLPFIYIMSSFFIESIDGYIHMSIINLIIVSVLRIIAFMESQKTQTGFLGSFIEHVGPTFPIYSLYCALRDVYKNFAIRRTCARSYLTPELKCATLPECCNIKSFYDWQEPGILKFLVYLVLVAITCFVIIFLLEYFLLDTIRGLREKPHSHQSRRKGPNQDADVREEEELIANMAYKDREKHNLVVDGVSKYYGNFLAVNHISLCIKRFECFGLLGMNGAGKTTTFKMMCGELYPSSGRIYVNGENFLSNKRKLYNDIGYCPQFDALPEELSARETLHMFLLINGVHERLANEKAEDLAALFGFLRYMDKPVKALSGGCKRKLSMAIATIGNPSLLFLDEPTTGMDPASRRQICNILISLRESGKSIVLTTHSLEDTEALCTRLTIMVNGEFRCIGSVQHLKNKYSKGLILKIKLKRTVDFTDTTSIRSFSEIPKITSTELMFNIIRLKTFIEQEIPDAELQDEYRFLITFTVPVGAMRYSELFELLETHQDELKIEDYFISQTSLEEVFLQFVQYQRLSTHYSLQRARFS